MGEYERVTALCKKEGIAITALEDMLGFGRGSIGKMKKSRMRYDRLKRIADHFGVSVEYITEGRRKGPKRFDDDITKLAERMYYNKRLRELVENFEKLNDEGQALICDTVKGFVASPIYVSGTKRRSSASKVG